jgi:hypothetical protein
MDLGRSTATFERRQRLVMQALPALVALISLAGCGGTTPPAERRAPHGAAIYALSVQHDSQMSESFRLVAMTIRIDERVVLEQNVDTPDGEGDAEVETPVCAFREMVQAGSHDVIVELLYRGRGHGLFSYLRQYQFRVRSTYVVDMPTNVYGVHIGSVGEEHGGATTPLEDRPSVRWTESVERSDPNAGCHPARSAG